MSDVDTVIIINRNGMGEADQVLQHKLIKSYLKLLDDHNYLPSAICFYAEGVHLAIDGSPVLQTLLSLEKKGVRLILCSTSLNYYSLTPRVKVGQVAVMGDILEAQWAANKVITL